MSCLRHLTQSLAAAYALATGACSQAPSTEQCSKLLEHVIDLEIAGGSGATKLTDDMKKDLEIQRKKVVDYATQQKVFMETCTKKTPRRVVECGLKAKNDDDLAKCDDSTAGAAK
jgi:hypothetical protein